MDEIELKLNSEVVEDLYDMIVYGHEEETTKQSIALVLHWYVKRAIDETEQRRLKGPGKTNRDQQGGHVDRVILLANLLGAGEIPYRILKVSNNQEQLYTLEALVENESEVQAVGVDAKQDYRFRESEKQSEMYWRPADPSHCRRAGRIEGLEEKNLIEKKTDGERRYYDWVEISDLCTVRP
ncbi:hypothetical protein [Haloarcula litorea]|uniref:hypothetical protein n=1 Tax=Haloarcula litorea TaxID=3032579 RepID=UPI0023E8A782|nr:hypothetical protein [Halomicroarcula sp. GDY20]